MRRFKSLRQAQRFLSAQGPIRQHFRPKRHKLIASALRDQMRVQFAVRNEVTELPKAS